MKRRKLEFSEELVSDLKKMRKLLEKVELDKKVDISEITAGSGCGDHCRITCSWHCEESCAGSCWLYMKNYDPATTPTQHACAYKSVSPFMPEP